MKSLSRFAACLLLFAAACADATATAPRHADELDRSVRLGKTAVADPTTTWKFPSAGASLSVLGDGKYSDGVLSVYANGVCGVTSRLFYGGSGDATMTLGADRRCVNAPRRLTLRYDDGVVETTGSGAFLNLHDVQNAALRIPVGTTVPGFLAIHYTPRCDALQFGRDANSDAVLVTRVDARTWSVESQAAPNNRAFCTTTGRAYRMPVSLIVVSSRDLPL